MKITKQKLYTKQLEVLQKRLDSGKALTVQQIAFVEKQLGKPDASTALNDDSPGGVCASVSALARRLGIHRQTVSYHQKREGAPKNLSVSEWRQYLENNGKLPTEIKLDNSSADGQIPAAVPPLFEAVFARTANGLSALLTGALDDCEVKLSPEKTDKLTLILWYRLAAQCQLFADEIGLSPAGPIKFNEDGTDLLLPPELESVRRRIESPRKKSAPKN